MNGIATTGKLTVRKGIVRCFYACSKNIWPSIFSTCSVINTYERSLLNDFSKIISTSFFNCHKFY